MWIEVAGLGKGDSGSGQALWRVYGDVIDDGDHQRSEGFGERHGGQSSCAGELWGVSQGLRERRRSFKCCRWNQRLATIVGFQETEEKRVITMWGLISKVGQPRAVRLRLRSGRLGDNVEVSGAIRTEEGGKKN